MTNIKNSSSQRGVALLFALGILSLLLVMGVAFLGNTLISQKIAVNSREAASAKLLGQTAVDQMLSHLTLFHLAQVRNAGDFYASDASSVFSRLSTAAYDGNILNTRRDSIYTDNSPLLTINRGQQGDAGAEKRWYDGSKSLAEWIYVHEDGKFSDGSGSVNSKIVGRFAYQVLPQTSNSRLSLYAVTAGATRRAGHDLDTAATARIPQKHRWGVDVDELVIPNGMFTKYWKHDSTELCDPLHEFDNFISILSGSKNGADYFYGDSKVTESRKRWLEHIFAEGRGRVAREAYWGGDGWYPRFNLGRFTHYWDSSAKKRVPVRISGSNNWYQRFLDVSTPPADSDKETQLIDAIKNGPAAVDALAKAQVTSGKYTDAFTYDGQYEAMGLPFLRRIGNLGEKGSFEFVKDLRSQIIANLNDYCDEDSVPTSNVPAAEWGNRVGSGAQPLYTGNEKTTYINEVAFGFKLHGASVDADPGKCLVKTDIKGEMIAELIGIYKGLPDSTLKLHGELKSLSCKLKLSLQGKASYKADGGSETKNVEFTAEPLTLEKDVAFSSLAAGELIPVFKRNGSYWVGKKDLALAAPGTVEFDLTQAVKDKFEGTTITDVKIEVQKVKFEVIEVKFEPGHFALHDSAAGTFVDFVKSEAGERAIVPDPANGIEAVKVFTGTDGWIEADNLSTETAADKGFFYAGSMCAIDPRQNLHAMKENVVNSDWYCTLIPALGKLAAGTFEWDKVETRLGGEMNTYSNPNAPRYATGIAIPQNEKDVEKSTVPEYKAAAGTEPEKMISTAVIRNAPMMSPWELGFIHRGIPFQTINLKKAGGIGNNKGTSDDPELKEDAHAPGNFSSIETAEGTLYKNGDAGILDQIKMTDLTKSYGKVDISALKTQPANWVTGGESFETLSKELFKSLFENVKSHSAVNFVEKVTDRAKAPSFDAGMESDPKWTYDEKWFNGPVTTLRSKFFGNNDDFCNSITAAALDTDAAQEELIGKIINLVEGRGASLPNVFKVVVVAQAIRDLQGPVVKLDAANAQQTVTAALGKFDATISGTSGSDIDKSVYFDEILGQSRMLVTVEKLHYFESDVPRARLRVKQVQYLD